MTSSKDTYENMEEFLLSLKGKPAWLPLLNVDIENDPPDFIICDDFTLCYCNRYEEPQTELKYCEYRVPLLENLIYKS